MIEIVLRSVSDLKKLDSNPRIIKDDDFKKLCSSIETNKDYFNARPLILSDRTGELIIIAGNQRFEAAKKIGLRQVPTFLIEGLSEEREKEITIRDNVSSGQWDWDSLANEFDPLSLEEWGVGVWKEEDKTNKVSKSLLIKFNPNDIGVARELLEYFKNEGIYVGGSIIEKLKDLKNGK